MKNDLKIRTLTERFFDGETSLAEEQELYRLYREGDVPEDLLQYKELFCGFEDIRLPQQKASSHQWKWVIGIAASIAILLAIGATLHTRNSKDECVAYIYGKKCTDKTIVMQHMQSALDEMDNVSTIDEQMRDFFSE